MTKKKARKKKVSAKSKRALEKVVDALAATLAEAAKPQPKKPDAFRALVNYAKKIDKQSARKRRRA